jgi:chromosome partitioning protein
MDRFLERLGHPRRVMRAILSDLGRDYELVIVDCPAGSSRLTEGVLAAANLVLVPTIPTVLSLRTLLQLLIWADANEATFELAAFFSMVDRRKTLHRRTSERLAGDATIFLDDHIPYASVVEEMAVRRMPLGEFAPREPATAAFGAIWREIPAG